jgi:hypothetical protein
MNQMALEYEDRWIRTRAFETALRAHVDSGVFAPGGRRSAIV